MVSSWNRAGNWVIPSHGEAAKRLSPCPSLPLPRAGASLSPPRQHALHSPGPVTSSPGNVPSKRQRRGPDGPVTTVPSRPASRPPYRVICLHRELCPSSSPAPRSEQGGRGTRAEQLPFFPEQMTLGQPGTAWPEFKQPSPAALGSRSFFHTNPRE